MTETTTDLTVIEVPDRDTGELVNVRTAPIERLAQMSTRAAELRSELAAIEATISDELVARLDRDLSWTARTPIVGDVQFEITAPTPAQGTTAYDDTIMERELAQLVEAGTISQEAAADVLRRHVTLTLRVPFGFEFAQIVNPLKDGDSVNVAGVECGVVDVGTSRQVMASGVTKIAKFPPAAGAVDAARITTTPPKRKAKIKIKTKER
jgi:hypothetical protein